MEHPDFTQKEWNLLREVFDIVNGPDTKQKEDLKSFLLSHGIDFEVKKEGTFLRKGKEGNEHQRGKTSCEFSPLSL